MLAQLLKKNAPAYKGLPADARGKIRYALALYASLLQPHMALEEKRVYPFAAERSARLAGMVEGLQAEHRQIERLFSQLQAGQPNLELLDELGYLLERHIRTEERVFFQELQQVAGEQLRQLNTEAP